MGVKTYSDPSHIYSWGPYPQPPGPALATKLLSHLLMQYDLLMFLMFYRGWRLPATEAVWTRSSWVHMANSDYFSTF